MLLTCLTYPLPACMRAHLHTLMPLLHHDIAHTLLSYMHTYLYIPADSVSYTVIDSHTHTYGHTSFSAAPHITILLCYSETTHSCTAPPYLAAWMSGPLAYTYIFSSDVCAFYSHRAQVLI